MTTYQQHTFFFKMELIVSVQITFFDLLFAIHERRKHKRPAVITMFALIKIRFVSFCFHFQRTCEQTISH